MGMFRGSYEDNRQVGQFTNCEFNVTFDYRICSDEWGMRNGFAHEIAMSDGSVRFGNVKKTVIHICIDEDQYGKPIIEKWKIKQHSFWGSR
jgi:hypothetical protein